MALIARIQHPYIVEFKEGWVEKVGPRNSGFVMIFFSCKCDLCTESKALCWNAGLLCFFVT